MRMVTTSKAFSEKSTETVKQESRFVHRLTDQNSLQQQQQFFSPQQSVPQMERNFSNAMIGNSFCQEEQGLMMMQDSPYSYTGDVKPSPSYMDDDVQFNYPDARCSQVKTEPQTFSEGAKFPDKLSVTPKLQRQHSLLNTLMEVIDDHDINDISSTFSATPMPQQSSQPNRCLQTHPINIQRQPTNNMAAFNCDSFQPPMGRGTPGQNFTVAVPPASDTRKYNQFGVSPADSCSGQSPSEGMPFVRYQQNLSTSHLSRCDMTNHLPSFPMTQNHFSSNDQVNLAFQATEDVMSPSQSVESPCTWQQMQQPVDVHSASNYGGDDVFLFDDFENQHFKPSQSCPNFSHGMNINADIPTCSGQNIEHIPYPPKTHSNMSSVASPSTPQSIDLFCGQSLSNTQLEEVNSASFKRLSLGRPLTEQERADAKRIRNNMACQASRERRKRRKAERETQARNLEAENFALKQQIRKLELDVRSAHECVKRRMSQS